MRASQSTEYIAEKLQSIDYCLHLNRRNQENLKELIGQLTSQQNKLRTFIQALDSVNHKVRTNTAEFYAYNLPVTTRSPMISLFKKLRSGGGLATETIDQDILPESNNFDNFSFEDMNIEDEDSESEFEWNFIEKDRETENYEDFDDPLPSRENYNNLKDFISKNAKSEFQNQTSATQSKMDTLQNRISEPIKQFKRIAKKGKMISKFSSKQLVINPNKINFAKEIYHESDESSMEEQDTLSNQTHTLAKVRTSAPSSDIFALVGKKIEGILELNIKNIVSTFKIDLSQPLCLVNYREVSNSLNTSQFLETMEAPIYPVNIYRVLRKAQKFEQKINEEWSNEELTLLSELVQKFGINNWKQISVFFSSRSFEDCRKKFTSISEVKTWDSISDVKLVIGVVVFDYAWVEIANRIFNRTKSEIQCRERFSNLLNPNIFDSNSDKNEMFLIVFYRLQGKRWAWISKHILPHRTDNKLLRLYRLFRKNYPKIYEEIRRSLGIISNFTDSAKSGVRPKDPFKVYHYE